MIKPQQMKFKNLHVKKVSRGHPKFEIAAIILFEKLVTFYLFELS